MKNGIKVAKIGIIISLFALGISSITLIMSAIKGEKDISSITIFFSAIAILCSNIAIYKSIKVDKNKIL